MAEPPAAAGGRGAAPAPRPAGTDPFVWGVAVGQTVSWGVLYYAFAVLLVPMQRSLGWPRSLLVGGFTAAVALSGLLAPMVGRRLDRDGPRAIMTAGSLAGAVLVAAWSRADHVAAYYAVWAGIGVAMALVLYEPAFTVVAKRYAPHHHRAITFVTLVAGTSSLLFQPLTSALVSAHGWRTALLVLAGLLAVVTVPLHLVVLPAARAGDGTAPVRPVAGRAGGGRRPPDGRFWPLTAAFAGATVTSFGASVLLVTYLVDHAWTLRSGALAAGTLGVMQLPGRVLLLRLHGRLPLHTLVRLALGLPGVGVALLVASGGTPLVWAAVVVLGAGQGMNTLLRATIMVDLYGTQRLGALNGLSATPVVLARATAPLVAALLTTLTGGYTVPFLLLAGIAAVASASGGRTVAPAADGGTADAARLGPSP